MHYFSILLAVAFGTLPVTTLPAQQAPPLVEKLYKGNWPSDAEAQELLDELFYQRAVHAYMTMLPALNTIGMRDGSEKVFGKGYNVLPIWKDRMDSRCWVPTPNADVIYSMSYLDLKETGPLVVAAPTKSERFHHTQRQAMACSSATRYGVLETPGRHCQPRTSL